MNNINLPHVQMACFSKASIKQCRLIKVGNFAGLHLAENCSAVHSFVIPIPQGCDSDDDLNHDDASDYKLQASRTKAYLTSNVTGMSTIYSVIHIIYATMQCLGITLSNSMTRVQTL